MDLLEAQDHLFTRLCDTHRGVFLIEGPALVGKTGLLTSLAKRLKEDGPEKLAPLLFTCSRQHAGYEPVLDTIEHLLQRKNWVIGKQVNPLKVGIYVLKGILHLAGIAFPNMLSQGTLDKLREKLESSIAKSSQDSPLNQFSRSDAYELHKHLVNAIAASGRRVILLIDELEDLSIPGIKLLQLIVESVPLNLVMLLAASTDASSYRERQDISESSRVF